MRPIPIAAIVLTALGIALGTTPGIALGASAHTSPQRHNAVSGPGARPIVVAADEPAPPEPAQAAPPASTEVTPIESPPLPRPRPPSADVPRDNPAAMISAFRRQHGQGPVASNATLTRLAQQQANAMAARSSLDHDVAGSFASRMSATHFSPAAENIAYGHSDFPNTLKQWINSPGHRVNLLMRGAKAVGVARASNGRQTYWAMIIGSEIPREPRSGRAGRRGTGPLEFILR